MLLTDVGSIVLWSSLNETEAANAYLPYIKGPDYLTIQRLWKKYFPHIDIDITTYDAPTRQIGYMESSNTGTASNARKGEYFAWWTPSG